MEADTTEAPANPAASPSTTTLNVSTTPALSDASAIESGSGGSPQTPNSVVVAPTPGMKIEDPSAVDLGLGPMFRFTLDASVKEQSPPPQGLLGDMATAHREFMARFQDRQHGLLATLGMKRCCSPGTSAALGDDLETKRRKMEADEPDSTKKRRNLSSLRHSCNEYERNLLGCVVESEKLNISYADVHVKSSAKTSLQSLTLALEYPEEFTYGVLASSNLTGFLLYGPPGTGKTMLVKAFAGDSGATVLEISGADVHNKYVGEGEKTIQAIFSLARKLHPCVVFIDEVDGMFGRRGAEDKRHQRTELNQFLREWDGMSSELGHERIVLIAATNRPFDIDDAVLRRLPLRILIDIPEVRDRAEILRIHLQGETLAPDVSIDELARTTPFYTGSDLKNLVVAAAVHCVREMVAARKQARDAKEAEATAPRRVLRMEHLIKARNEIRPGTSKEALAAIREFHCKYGNTSRQD